MHYQNGKESAGTYINNKIASRTNIKTPGWRRKIQVDSKDTNTQQSGTESPDIQTHKQKQSNGDDEFNGNGKPYRIHEIHAKQPYHVKQKSEKLESGDDTNSEKHDVDKKSKSHNIFRYEMIENIYIV